MAKPKQSQTTQGKLTRFVIKHRVILALIGIIGLGAFMRFWQLDTIPPGLHPDEAANGQDIFRILEQNDHRPLYNTNGPRESLFFYLQAIFVAAMGNSILALRLAPAFIGTASIFTTFLWARSWFGRRVALLAAFMMAVTPWAIIMSRMGFRASMTPLFVSLVLYFYTRAFQERKDRWFIAAGFTLGLGFYTYLAFQLLPAALLAGLGFLWLFRRDKLKNLVGSIWISVAAFCAAMVPMAIYAIISPGDVFARAAGTSFTNPEYNGGDPLGALADSVVKTMLQFNIAGDENFRHNIGGQPLLNVFVGIMFLLGILWAIVKIRRFKYFMLLAVFGVMLLPAALTVEGLPHALRSVGAIPATFILAALGIDYMLTRWHQTFPVNSAARAVGSGAVTLLLALTAFQGFYSYFTVYPQTPDVYDDYSEDAVAIGTYLREHPFEGKRVVAIDGYSFKTVDYLAHGHTSYEQVDPGNAPNVQVTGPTQIIVSRSHIKTTGDKLRQRFPASDRKNRLTTHHSTFNDRELFEVFEVTP